MNMLSHHIALNTLSCPAVGRVMTFMIFMALMTFMASEEIGLHVYLC